MWFSVFSKLCFTILENIQFGPNKLEYITLLSLLLIYSFCANSWYQGTSSYTLSVAALVSSETTLSPVISAFENPYSSCEPLWEESLELASLSDISIFLSNWLVFFFSFLPLLQSLRVDIFVFDLVVPLSILLLNFNFNSVFLFARAYMIIIIYRFPESAMLIVSVRHIWHLYSVLFYYACVHFSQTFWVVSLLQVIWREGFHTWR
jgi:hypothetical protein